MPEAETRKEAAGNSKADLVKMWKQEIRLHGDSSKEGEWRKRATRVLERYRDERRHSDRNSSAQRFNIFYSNVETLKPSIYSKTPEPDVRRRYLDKDPDGRTAAEMLERALSAMMDDERADFDVVMEAVRDDVLLPGRGVARVRYEAEIVTREAMPLTQAAINQDTGEEEINTLGFVLDGQPVEPEIDAQGRATVEEKVDERVWAEYVPWQHFRYFPASAERWDQVYAVGFRHFMTQDMLAEQFGTKSKDVTLGAEMTDEKDGRDKDVVKRAEVWEIWDKRVEERVWFGWDDVEPIEVEDDPLNLEGFFPCPRPLYAIKTNDSMVPVPELTLYQDQADELDNITSRINHIIDMIRVRGAWDSTLKAMGDILQAPEGEMVSVDGAAFAEKGIAGALWMVPIEQYAQVLVVLTQQRAELKQEIYEITGISDLMRGATKASETATAQRIKGTFGAQRSTPRQKPMERFARDLLRIMAEVAAEHFSPETFARMTGMQPEPQVMELLRDEKVRGFRIDIETDSTVQPDAEAEKQNTVEFVTSITGYMETAATIGAQVPQMTPLLMEMLKFAMRRFKVGRTLEQVIDETADQLSQAAQQPAGPSEAEVRAQEAQQSAQVELEKEQIRAGVQDRRTEAGLMGEIMDVAASANAPRGVQ